MRKKLMGTGITVLLLLMVAGPVLAAGQDEEAAGGQPVTIDFMHFNI